MNKNFDILKTFIIIFVVNFSIKLAISSECEIKNNLRVGIIPNDFTDYKHYLYYTLGDYSLINDINFDIGVVDYNLDEFDIIFGEFRELNKLSKSKIEIPNKLKEFYEENKITINNNIYPLDLDTLILLSHTNRKVSNLEDLTSIYDSARYTTAIPLLSNDIFLKLIINGLKREDYISYDANNEYFIDALKKIQINSNKNILNANNQELYNSYEDKENIFTLFSDGILLYKNINYQTFDLFPETRYLWNEEMGIFDINTKSPISFFGFSALVLNKNQIGFLCYLTEENIRMNTFKNFNIGISPLSLNEVKKIKDNLSDKHIEILEKKNLYILNPYQEVNELVIKNLKRIILGQMEYKDLLNKKDYLN